MSLADSQLVLDSKGKTVEAQWADGKTAATLAAYQPTGMESERLAMVRSDFTSGYTLLYRPRREFNDLSLITRTAIDQMSWAVYQPNDGDSLAGEDLNGWRSNAVRPIVRNKVFSVASHVASRLLVPEMSAFDDESNEQKDAAEIMSDLMEYISFSTNATYLDVSLQAIIAALVVPVSLVWTEYTEVYRTIKTDKKDDGTWNTKQMLDEDLSGFRDESIPVDQIFIQDFYQPDVQKQGWIIRRRVRPYTLMQTMYKTYDNFKYVRPGVQVLFNDANQQFYEAYDLTMRQDECEEIIYLNKQLDLKLLVVNGILMSDPDCPNPREDKLYPLAAFGYEYLRPNGDCFYYKSLAFKTMPDDKIVNTLYPMIIDGTYLAIMPPMVNIGGEIITSDVIAPGAVTTFSDPNSDLKPLAVQNENLKAGMDALFKVESNITDDAFQPLMQGDMPEGGGNITADTMQRMEANAKLMLGPFVDMTAKYVKQMTRLRIGDIKQYLTLPEVTAIEGSANQDLVYKSFILPQGKTRGTSKRIKFTNDTPTGNITKAEHLKHSYKVLQQENDSHSKHSLALVNPILFRNLKYMARVNPQNAPLSEEIEASWNLAIFDRAVASPPGMYDPNAIAELLLKTSPTTRRHPEKYLVQPGQQPGQPPNPQQLAQVQQATQQQNNVQLPAKAQPIPESAPVMGSR